MPVLDADTRGALDLFLGSFADTPAGGRVRATLSGGADGPTPGLFRGCIAELEQRFRGQPPTPREIALYQALFRGLEAGIPPRDNARRHDFVVVIPVADRPRQLETCLDSLQQLCARFGYGVATGGKVSVLVADDSREEENRGRTRELCNDLACRGLPTRYFGQREQLAVIDRFTGGRPERLAAILGETDPCAFSHKGASRTRNIACLRLRELAREGGNPLFFFVDSDQEFRVRRDDGGEGGGFAVNHFHYLDRIFSETPASVLTGKVVGDPPVSPAVMSGRFLSDVTAFLDLMGRADPAQGCRFHPPGEAADPAGAAYHDMADLFGFDPAAEAGDYRCPLPGSHPNRACFHDFARRCDRFFDGAHPTRVSRYRFSDPLESLAPARTVYTGNYVLRPEALRFFIPFAPLQLRMAGPVLGRLIRAEIGDRFVSANLPLLHRRTEAGSGTAEFRPGIDRERESVELGGEYERQFFGDVMLFSIERLVAEGYPRPLPASDRIRTLVEGVEGEMYRRYRDNRQRILARLRAATTLLEDPAAWWQRAPAMAGEIAAFQRFFRNIERNFGPGAQGFRMITDPQHRGRRLDAIVRAIAAYPADRERWERLPEAPPP